MGMPRARCSSRVDWRALRPMEATTVGSGHGLLAADSQSLPTPTPSAVLAALDSPLPCPIPEISGIKLFFSTSIKHDLVTEIMAAFADTPLKILSQLSSLNLSIPLLTGCVNS